ncbi:unnamed protein product, partial [Mycena citricolor]
ALIALCALHFSTMSTSSPTCESPGAVARHLRRRQQAPYPLTPPFTARMTPHDENCNPSTLSVDTQLKEVKDELANLRQDIGGMRSDMAAMHEAVRAASHVSPLSRKSIVTRRLGRAPSFSADEVETSNVEERRQQQAIDFIASRRRDHKESRRIRAEIRHSPASWRRVPKTKVMPVDTTSHWVFGAPWKHGDSSRHWERSNVPQFRC